MGIDDPVALASLIDRLQALRPEAERRWGTMTVGEMLCHLGDGNDWLRGLRPVPGPEKVRHRRVLKWIALYSSFRWAKGAKTHPKVDPKADGTKPADFEADRARIIEGLKAVAAQPTDQFPAIHPLFGPMSQGDWFRSAYRHYDHHLKQFGG